MASTTLSVSITEDEAELALFLVLELWPRVFHESDRGDACRSCIAMLGEARRLAPREATLAEWLAKSKPLVASSIAGLDPPDPSSSSSASAMAVRVPPQSALADAE